MNQMANSMVSIKEIQIENFLDQPTAFLWKLHEDVSVLAGANGSGKSYILNILQNAAQGIWPIYGNSKIRIEFSDGTILKSDEEKYSPLVLPFRLDFVTPLNFDIKALWYRYQTHQTLLFDSKVNQEISSNVKECDTAFFEILKVFFSEKSLKRIKHLPFLNSTQIAQSLGGFSDGEKRLLNILYTVLLQYKSPAILILDDPEAFFHFDWQKILIENIKKLNSNIQIIISTHSPAIIMEGWMEQVVNIEDLLLSKSPIEDPS